MNPATPALVAEQMDSDLTGPAEIVSVNDRSINSIASPHTSGQIAKTSTIAPVLFGSSHLHQRQNGEHAQQGNNPHTEVSSLVQYLKEERHAKSLFLDSVLFPEGVQPGDVVEVWGSANNGKSMLTLTLIASALLPKIWNGIEVGGCNTGVILIDCDQNFSIFQLVSLMYKRVKSRLKLAKNILNEHKRGKTGYMIPIFNIKQVTQLLRCNKIILKAKIEEMVQGCLKSLYYIKCIESMQFPIALAALDEHLAKYIDVSLVVVDSLSAFCWYDWIYRGRGNFIQLKKYYDRVFGVLLENIKKYKVVLLAVKHALFLKTSEEISKKVFDEQKEQETFKKQRRVKDHENDMEEADSMENMICSEYLGYLWVSSVTWQIIVSKVKVNPRTVSCVSEQGAMVVRTPGTDRTDHQVFLAEVKKGTCNIDLHFVVGEEGIMWQKVAHAL